MSREIQRYVSESLVVYCSATQEHIITAHLCICKHNLLDYMWPDGGQLVVSTIIILSVSHSCCVLVR